MPADAKPAASVIPLTPSVEFDAALVRKLDQTGPRYTSYPTADRFSGGFGPEQYRHAVASLDADGNRSPLSLYVHIPFCASLCYYCCCNKIITQDQTKAVEYLGYLHRESALQEAARASGFRSISVDLIYGLPLQSVASFGPTLDKIVAALPDRIAVYNYAHMPRLFKAQRLIVEEQLPDAETKLAMLGLCIERLTAAGYVYIGMDNCALPEDDLARSQREGGLQRNFQGYSTHADAPMVALGVSAISAVGASYSQNEKTLPAYYERLGRGELPIARGIGLSEDDLLRRAVIGQLMCDFELDYARLAIPGGIDARVYFAAEIERLKPLEDEGLLCIGSKGLKVKMRGRLLIRNICMAFDSYLHAPLPEGPAMARYSRTI